MKLSNTIFWRTCCLWTFCVALSMWWSPLALAQNEANALETNRGLSPGQMLRSSNKQFKAIMQGDGNFVVYREPNTFVWATGTNGRGPVTGVWMQPDGNLCVNGPTAALWCSASNGPQGSYFMLLRDNGGLEVYRGTPANAATAPLVWTSVLDANYYAGRYADLRQAFGSNTRQLMEHWITYGRFEGRSPKNGISDEGRQNALSVSLDTVFYANKYPDLKQTFGYDAQRLYQHWMTLGRTEGRVPNKATEEFLAAPPRSANGQAYMRNVDWLHTEEAMRSPNGRFFAVLQGDLNLVIYEGSRTAAGHRWNYGAPGGNGQAVLRMQNDGHFCVYRGTVNAQGQGVRCVPFGAGGPLGRYFLALQDDGNLVVYKGAGPADNRGWIWDRITTAPSRGFNFAALAESIANVVVSTANSVGSTTVNTANTVAAGTVTAANAIGNEVVRTANKTARDVVNTANLVANTTENVAVQVGASIEAGAVVVGNEIVKDGKIVGYAVANAAREAWNFLNNNCGVIGRTAFPLQGTQYFKTVDWLSNIFVKSSVVDPTTKRAFQDINAVNATAGRCFEKIQDGFYCAMPGELASLVSQAGQMPGNLINLSTRVFNAALLSESSPDCRIVGAATYMTGPLGLQMCGLGKVVVEDVTKAVACFSAAESKGLMRDLTYGAGSQVASDGFPSDANCQRVGALGLTVAMKVVSNALTAEAKAATAAGKSNTAAQVASELKSIYGHLGRAAKYNEIVDKLNEMPECK